MEVFVASEADEASRSQRIALLNGASWQQAEPFDGRVVWRLGERRLVTIGESHLYRDRIDRDLEAHFGRRPDLVVFLSKHRSESGKPSLTVHPIGNFRGADFGGRPETLVESAPGWMTAALRGLRREAARLPYEVTFEATHHGPFLETPTFYIEQGSTEREWKDPAASRAIARALLSLEPVRAPVALGLGGGHYAPRHTDLAVERRIAFGHLLPAYALGNLSQEMLAQAVQKTPGAILAYVHRKSLSKPDVRKWEERLASLGLRVVREGDLSPEREAKDS